MKKYRVIINADDFGYNETVNSAIEYCVENGLISSATIIANGAACEAACKYASAGGSGVSFGVHLNLTEFEPLTKSATLSNLNLLESLARRKRFAREFSASLSREVEREWTAQVSKIIDFGVKVSHLDGHNNIHWSPNLFFALKAVQKKFGIRRVRGIKNINAGGISQTKRAFIATWRFMLKNFYKTKTPDFLTDYFDFLEASPSLPQGSTLELMCHPGGKYMPSEFDMLKRDELSKKIIYKLINYNDL